MSEFTKAAKVGEIAQGMGKVVEINGRAIALFYTNGQYYALDNFCPHKGGPLGEGVVVGTTAICPWHRWPFDVTTGNCMINPAAKVETFEVKVEGDDILVRA